MHLHINHVFCTDSNWGGDYWSRYMVCLDTLRKIDQEDCKNLLIEKKGLNEQEWEVAQKVGKKLNWTDEQLAMQKRFCEKRYKMFKPEVLDWLAANVADVKDKEQPKAWCVGTDEYQITGDRQINVWFVRRKDALEFIRVFSVHKKPTTYFDYFKEIRKELDLNKNVLRVVENYSKEIEASIYDR